jgi:methionyl aminopeptidase
MSMIKTPAEISAMAEGGALLSHVLQTLVNSVGVGVTMHELDALAERLILENGATPSFKGYRSRKGDIPFPSTVCISRNNEVVHGLGNRKFALEEGDIVGFDIGCWYKGLCTDMAVTVPVGRVSAKDTALMQITRNAMRAGVEQAIAGQRIEDIARAIESSVPKGYGIVKALVGHGVGHAVHENPNVPNYVSKAFPDIILREGMCLALEPMITLGTDDVALAEDGWTIVTKDGSDAAHFEVTLAVTADGPLLLTPEPEVPGI